MKDAFLLWYEQIPKDQTQANHWEKSQTWEKRGLEISRTLIVYALN